MDASKKHEEKSEAINVAKVTQMLLGHIMAMSAEERLALLGDLEEKERKRREAEKLQTDRDKRMSPRVLYTAEVDFVVGETPYKGMILDISEEGARIASCDIPPAGTEVRMAFRLPGRRNAHVCMLGVVVRDAEKDFGVHFHKGLNPALRRYDTKILGKREPGSEG